MHLTPFYIEDNRANWRVGTLGQGPPVIAEHKIVDEGLGTCRMAIGKAKAAKAAKGRSRAHDILCELRTS